MTDWNDNFYLFDDMFVKDSTPMLSPSYAADNMIVLYEDMFVAGSKLPFWSYHYKVILESLSALGVENAFTYVDNNLRDKIIRLVNKNKQFTGASVRLMFFISQSGEIHRVVFSKKIKLKNFMLNHKGLVLKQNEIKIPVAISPLSWLKLYDAHYYIYKNAESKRFEEVNYLVNTKDEIIDTTDNSIFVVQGGKVITPGKEQGAKLHAMQLVLADYIRKMDYGVVSQPLKYNDFMKADEVFLANDVLGVLWVVGFNEKRYRKNLSVKLVEMLQQSMI